jgi:predicted O-methyltransferase YrrM
MKKFLKNFKIIRRLYDAYIASRYFNNKYIKIIKWMFNSNEDTNYTYDLEEKNLDELYKLLENIFEINYSKIKDYSEELINNSKFKDYLKNKIETSDFKKFADTEIKYSRRIGWYVIARIIKPKLIIETGVDKGMGSVILSEALIKNRQEGFKGKYLGTDINPEAGYLFDDLYRKNGKILYGDSIESLKKIDEPVDLFINDSDHSAKYEADEYKTMISKLSKNSVILGDNSHSTDELLKFSIEHGRSFILFRERPKNHWYPGAGIGISFIKK